ncbi:MAG TPA: DJ-1/PfpI family protein [Pyrinomonadaceae bacterium]|jgi:putative intracellular protease/amidase|nr:DJ-1/PfpI family protein [Pyrinomonadaceae bacterium]
MKPKAYLLVFDGMADWEPAHALCEINKSQKYDVVAAGFSDKQVTTMGGLKLISEITIRDVNPAEACIFIMPGGDMWESCSDEGLIDLLHELHAENVPVGAICGATLEIARAGLTRNVRHTSNGKEYLKTMVPDYRDEEYYVDELAVSDNNLITASGLGSVEFGREIIQQLGIYNEGDTKLWFDMFKRGVLP